MKKLELMILGLVAGFASAALGIGGGVVIVPALVLFLGFDIKKAAGSSLAALVPIALVGVLSHYVINSDNIRWLAVLFTAVGAVSGAKIGERFNRVISGKHLEWLLALLLMFTALKLVNVIRMPSVTLTGGMSYPFLVVLGLFAGTCSALFGIGGGVIMVPGFYLLFGFSMHEAVPTSLAVIFPTAIAGFFFHFKNENVDRAAVKFMVPLALVGAVAGAVLSNSVSGDVLRKAFAAFMFFYAIKLFTKKNNKA
jgi:uncharacterized membrane protein YfcA